MYLKFSCKQYQLVSLNVFLHWYFYWFISKAVQQIGRFSVQKLTASPTEYEHL